MYIKGFRFGYGCICLSNPDGRPCKWLESPYFDKIIFDETPGILYFIHFNLKHPVSYSWLKMIKLKKRLIIFERNVENLAIVRH